MAKKMILYRKKVACEIQPDMERQVVWLSFATALGGAQGQPQAGQRRYDWKNKVTFAASPAEVLSLAQAARLAGWGRLKEPLQLYHDPGKSERASGPPKALDLRSGEGTKAPAFLTLRQGENRWDVSLSTADLLALETLLPLSVAAMWGWVAPGTPGFRGAEGEPSPESANGLPEVPEAPPEPPEPQRTEAQGAAARPQSPPQGSVDWQKQRKDLNFKALGDIVGGDGAQAAGVLDKLLARGLIKPDSGTSEIVPLLYKIRAGQLALS